MNKSRGFLSIAIPSATVFISSACIMVLELVASRLIARHLGSSLYTWTSVIGVVLAGITIGNYLGGRIADKFQARKTLAVLFALSSAACVVIVILNSIVGEWMWLWHFSWPVRIFTHVSLVFLLPSVLLGTISPVVAKMALDKGLATGRTVGDIYAWGAAGSIAGTFLAGFYLIATMGTVAIIWTVGGTLLLMAILYGIRLWGLYIWAIFFIVLATTATTPVTWAKTVGENLGLREKSNPNIIYESESQYCYIAVKQLSKKPDRRLFMQDKLKHSEIVMDDILDLRYPYEQIHAAATHLLSQNKNKLSVLVIGGGGYVFPRYVEKVWPGSRIDVVEIDPGVTEAAIQAFGLSRNTSINTINMDARNYVDELLVKDRNGKEIPRYDFIYEDALNDYSVPYQLTTKEFNDKIAQILTDDGVYMIELIDIYNSGLFVGSFINTLERTFPYVYVITENEPRLMRNTFVIIAANREINLENLASEKPVRNLDLWILNNSDMEELKKKENQTVLTDDYAPVENLLAPIVRRSGIELLSGKYRGQARKLKRQGKLDEAIAKYKELIEIDPTLSIETYNDIALILAGQGKLEEAIQNFREALAYNERSDFKSDMANIHFSLGTALQRAGKTQEASKEFAKAIKEFRQRLTTKNPDSVKTLIRLGDALASNGGFLEAARYFQQAVNLNPTILPNHFKLIQALELAGQLEQAVQAARKAIEFFSRNSPSEVPTKQLEQYLELLEFKKLKHQKQLN
ncbi:MAG: fused MFS/spermidine synthase [Planctomycetes bacterium]|nr:fused MFS/spermidine synthase [Planctomycetota bacterium]